MILASSSVSEHLISGLLPWSPHTLYIEACTIKGCTASDKVTSRTQEAPPEGKVMLQLRVTGQRQVEVKWNRVETPNGNVVYDVYFDGLEYEDPGENFLFQIIHK